MRRMLDHQYANQQIFRYSPQAPIKEIHHLSPTQLSLLKCVYGHFRYGIHTYFPRKPVYITMLRDPMDRILSMYYFIRSRPQNKLYPKVKNMSFTEYVMSPDSRIQVPLRNHQTRMISGERDPNLQKAKQNITNHFAVVGTMEMYPESVFMIKKALGWKHIVYTKQNVNKGRPKNTLVPNDVKARIHKNNSLDYQLYAYAKSRLHHQIQHLTTREKQQLEKFKQRHFI